ncbi:MAG: hypothetical protein WC471_05425 [Candidatus Woesearchaeota archaeon]
MQEKTLLKLAVVSSIIGLIILFVMSSFTQLDNTDISKLTSLDVDKTLKVTGIITKISQTEQTTMLEIAQHNRMPVLIFDTNLTLNKGDEVEIIGKAQDYNGELELIADRIERK